MHAGVRASLAAQVERGNIGGYARIDRAWSEYRARQFTLPVERRYRDPLAVSWRAGT